MVGSKTISKRIMLVRTQRTFPLLAALTAEPAVHFVSASACSIVFIAMYLILGRILPKSTLDFTNSISPIYSSKGGGGPKKGSRVNGLALLDPGPPLEQE
jgi:hypothetical protein